ncbi:MAG: GNAT family N-acetyltransferase [Acidobacteriia bacterium]|nr:GNAT family N-acetyltransferase [Terriglobia bacterium]
MSDLRLPALVDLRQLRFEDLEPLLEDEIREWQHALDWDFRPSAELVRRFVRMQALNGFALVSGARTVGYCYFVFEETKGLIGDLYVAQDHRCKENEDRLLGAVLQSLRSAPHLQRVESQLIMLSDSGLKPRDLPYDACAQSYRRNFMIAPRHQAAGLQPASPAAAVEYGSWHEGIQDAAARLIARSYIGHVDSLINDQYRSIAGARRFLTNIIQYPGCGSFFQPASVHATDPRTGRLCGISLASLVSFDVGHITQICVDPEVKGRGIGYEMLRRSMQVLDGHGCRRVSLTVTGSNREAIRLYRGLGFQTLRTFDAHVWEALQRQPQQPKAAGTP